MRAAAALAAAALALLAPAPALGHAVLTHTDPHQGAAVAAAPGGVTLDFNEPVEATAGAMRVFDAEGGRVDAGPVTAPGGDQRKVRVGLRAGLGRGVYTATYRVTSADGHPVSGGFSFAVGDAMPATARGGPTVAELLDRSGAGPAVEGLYGAARGLHYAALLLLVGALVFAGWVWPAGRAGRWPVTLLAGAAGLGALAALAGLVLQGALAAGVPLGRVLSPEALDAATSTRTGRAWGLRAGAWAAVLALLVLLPARRPSRPALAALALPAAVVIASLPYAGHADTQAPKGVLIPADVLHVLAAGAWLGGLVLLLAVFWPRRGRDGAVADGAAEATARFSRIALPAMAVLVAVGLAQSWFYLGSVGALVSSTYGWAIVAKVALLAGILALAARSRRRARTLEGGAAAAPLLRRSMLGEVALAVGVLAATATLVRAAPPVAAAQGPVVRQLDVGPLRLEMDVEPGKVGPNDYHLYLFDRRTGAQVDRVEEIEIRLTQADKGIGPITLPIPRKGPAHYELLASALGVKGTWKAQVDVRVSDFDLYTARTEFEVR